MTDLDDIFALAFGGQGAWCLLVAALASLLVSRKVRAGLVAGAAFLACWAYPFLALAGAYDRGVAGEAIMQALAALPQDAVWLAVRFGGIYAVVAVLWRARLALHGRKPVAKVEPRTA